MTWLEAVGYVASILVLSTFYMKTMLPLRCCAIASNIAFIAYGFFGEIYPVLVLHLVLLPLNIKRLHELRQLIRDIKRAADAGFSFEPMIPFLAMIGEIGLFAPTHQRTTSAICETDVVALVLTEDKVVQLYYQDPKFGFSLIQLVIRRLLADWAGRPGAAAVAPAAGR